MKRRMVLLVLAGFLLAGAVFALEDDRPKHQVELICPTAALVKGDSFQFVAKCDTGSPVFQTQDPKLLEISGDGLATALHWGNTEVILTVAETEERAALELRIPVVIAASHDPNPDDPDPPYEPTEPTAPAEPEFPPEPGMPTKFLDVTHDDYFAGAVDWALDNHVTTGIDEKYFGPDLSCTRAQVATFLWRAAGCPEPELEESPFRDVTAPDSYYYKAVLWAMEQGITTGTEPNLFSPDQGCTRAQVVTFLWRSAGEEPSVWGIKFSDVDQGQYYSEAVSWAVEHHITQGMGLNRFEPDNGCTRAQIVTFLFRYMR